MYWMLKLTVGACESKVAELDDSALGEEDVLGLDITVETVVDVAEVGGLQGLPHHAQRRRQRNPGTKFEAVNVFPI